MTNETIINKIIIPLVIIVVGFIIYLILIGILNKALKLRAKRFKDNKYNTIEALIKGIRKIWY